MDIESKELTEYVKGVLDSIKKSETDDYQLKTDIEFELAIVNKKGVDAGFQIFVVNANGKYEKDVISKIKFSMGKNIKNLSYTVSLDGSITK